MTWWTATNKKEEETLITYIHVKIKFSQLSMKSWEKLSPPHDSVVCRTTFSNGFLYFISLSSLTQHCGWILEDSSLQCFHLLRFVGIIFLHNSHLRFHHSHFNRVDGTISTHWFFDSFLFQFCCRFTAVLGVIVLLHGPFWAKL